MAASASSSAKAEAPSCDELIRYWYRQGSRLRGWEGTTRKLTEGWKNRTRVLPKEERELRSRAFTEIQKRGVSDHLLSFCLHKVRACSATLRIEGKKTTDWLLAQALTCEVAQLILVNTLLPESMEPYLGEHLQSYDAKGVEHSEQQVCAIGKKAQLLRSLSISGDCKATDEALVALGTLPLLRELRMEEWKEVSCKALGSFLLKAPALESLSLRACPKITGNSWVFRKGALKKIHSLQLDQALSSYGLQQLLHATTGLQRLTLTDRGKGSGWGDVLLHAGSSLRQVEAFSWDSADPISSTQLKGILRSMPNLRSLHLGTHIPLRLTHEGETADYAFSALLPRLQDLEIGVDEDQALANNLLRSVLLGVEDLGDLRLKGQSFSGPGFSGNLSLLRRLTLDSTSLTERSLLKVLQSAEQLKQLEIHASQTPLSSTLQLYPVFFDQLETLVISSLQDGVPKATLFDSDVAAFVSHCPNLRSLSLTTHPCDILHGYVFNASSFRKLERFHHDMTLSKGALTQLLLNGVALKELDIQIATIPDNWVSRVHALRKLCLRGKFTWVKDAAVLPFLQGSHLTLEELSFVDVGVSLSTESLSGLSFPKLKKLHLKSCWDVSQDKLLAFLKGSPHLTELLIEGFDAGHFKLDAIRKLFAHPLRISLSGSL